ncbi:MAG: AraC family ligand binding domain-containing protein [Lentisphaerae bacterium]|nr:AraC family ligand binding domain-containing protein [Lentisphaerota bacterium]
MDISITKTLPVFRETRFRQPSPLERKLGLWVDRIGATGDRLGDLRRLRILGQYAVVAVESGTGQCVIAAQGPRPLEAGDVLFLSPEQPTAYAPRQAWFTRWIVWNGPEARILAEMENRGEPVIRQAAAIVQQAFIALTHCIEDETAAAAIERKSILLSMLAELAVKRPVAAHATAMAGITDHIGRNLDRELKVPDLARMTHLPRSDTRIQPTSCAFFARLPVTRQDASCDGSAADETVAIQEKVI